MIPESIEIESIANALPIVRKEIAATKKKKAVERSSIDQRIDYRWIDLRTDENQLMFKAQSCFVNAMRKFLLDRNFIEIHTPKLIAAASESGSEVFKVDYFDRNAYLAQSPQFYKQMAMAAGFERIFETGPVFRAEKSYTNKHSTEFSGFVHKRWSLSIMGVIMGIIWFVTGMHWAFALGYLIMAIVADFVAGAGQYKSKKLNSLSYILFSLGGTDSYIVFFVDPNGWAQTMLGNGTEQSYIDTMQATANTGILIAMFAAVIITSAISAFVGCKMLKKQFEKAGITA